MKYQNILAIDTSSKKMILGLSFGGDRIVKSDENVEQSHGQIIIKKIDELLQSANLSKDKIDGIVVCTGPGSFTGLRIGIAAAKGIASALNIPITSCNIFELAAYKLRSYDETIKVITPLKKDEFFVTEVKEGKVVSDIKVVSDKELSSYLNGKISFVNCDFAVDFSDTDLIDLSDKAVYEAGDLLYLGRDKFENDNISDLTLLEPLYIQKSQAEINYDLRNKK